MKNLMMLTCVLLLGCGISPANQAGGNNHHSDKLKQLKLEWQYSLFSQVSASPVVAGGQLFVAAENGNLYSFNLKNKQFNWLYHTEAGIASTPVVVDGCIYFLSRDGFFYALEQSTGKRLWRFATGGETRFAAVGGYGLPADMGPVPDPWDFYLSSSLVRNGKVYFGSSDHHLYALDALSGELIWSFDAGNSIHSSPVYANGQIFFGTWGTRLYAVNAETGLEFWNFEGGTDSAYSVMQGITATPTVDADTVYIGARDGFVYALRQTDGAVLWRYDAAGSWVLSTAAIDEKNIYIGTSDTGLFLALDKKTGKETYRADTRLWTYASPLLVQNRYAFVGTMAGELYGFDKNTGKQLWYYQTPEAKADINDIINRKTGKFRSEKIFAADKQMQSGVEEVKALGAFVASPVWANNQLIAVSANGELLVFSLK